MDAPAPCLIGRSVPPFGVGLPPIGLGLADCRSAAAQQFWRMYAPSMLSVLPAGPGLSVFKVTTVGSTASTLAKSMKTVAPVAI